MIEGIYQNLPLENVQDLSHIALKKLEILEASCCMWFITSYHLLAYKI